MKTIGIVYKAPEIESLLGSQNEEEIKSKGHLVGLAFRPITSAGLIFSSEVHQVYYQPDQTPTGDLMGLSTGYYGGLINTIAPSHVLELTNLSDADSFLSQGNVIAGDGSLEFSNEITGGQLLSIGFSFFMKEELLSHISESTHVTLSGAKLVPGTNGVQISDPVIVPEYFNLKIQAIKQTGGITASSYHHGNIIGPATVMAGKPCPPAWFDNSGGMA